MNTYIVKKIGSNKGAPRIYLEGNQVERAGFNPGEQFNVDVSVEKSMVVLKLKDFGDRVVSQKNKGEKMIPVIDLNSSKVLSIFEGMDVVRVIMANNVIYIMPLASEVKKQSRLHVLSSKLANQEPISVGSLSHGVGVLSHAVHNGLQAAGLQSKLAFSLEIRDELLEQSAERNDAWDKETMFIAAPIQEFAFDEYAMGKLPKVDLLEMGLPCSGASVAGRAKRGTSHPEEHPEVGHLIAAAISIIAKVNPAAILFENVVPYQSSASMSILRNQLHDMGYHCHEDVIDGAEWNQFEARKRVCLVAVTDGVEFDFASLVKPEPVERKLSEILEDIPDDDPRWSKMAGLKAKEIRDKENGKNFTMQVFDGDSTKIGTITKGYAKIRSTDPKIRHASDPDLLRQLTPQEHAKCKGIPYELVVGLSNTIAHEALGQSILHYPFVAVAKLLGEQLMKFGLAANRYQPLLRAA